MLTRIGTTGLAAVLVMGCTALRLDRVLRPSPDDWVTEGGSGLRTNAGREHIRIPLRERWQYNAQAGIRAVPLVRDSTVFVATLNGELQAIHVSNGKRLGYKVFESAIVGTPALDGNFVVVTVSGKDQTVLSYNLQTGRIVWSVSAGPVESSPLLLKENVTITTLSGDVLCLRMSDGKEMWRFEGEGKDRGKGFRSSPSTDGDLIFAGSENGSLYALHAANGTLAWKAKTNGSIFATPVVAGDLVVVGNLDGRLLAADRKTGDARWVSDVGSALYAPVAASDGWIYCAVSDGSLLAFDSTGTQRWKFATKAVLNAAPFVNSSMVFVGSMDKMLYALDRWTGRELWRYEAEGRIRVSPVAWGKSLLLTAEDKYVSLLEPE